MRHISPAATASWPLQTPTLCAGLIAATLVLIPCAADAGSFDVFGYGARGIGLGGALTATVSDHTAVYYNPAGLARRDVVQLGTDMYTAVPSLSLDLQSAPQDVAYTPAKPPVHSGAGIGAVFPLVEGLNLGVALHIPLGRLLTVELLDPQVPQWYRYDALPGKIQIAAGLGYRLLDWVYVGVGFQSLASMEGDAAIALDVSNEQIPRRELSLELIHTASPTAGVVVEPPFAPGLSLGVSYRGDLSLEFGLPIAFDLGEALDFTIAATGITLYTPHEVSGGIAFDFRQTTGAPLVLSTDVTWSAWSLAPPPSVDFYLDFEGDLIDAAGAEDLLDFRVGQEPQAAFRDTVTVRAGGEWAPYPSLALRAGYAYRPSALAPATGFTNYVDTDAHLLSVGAATQFNDPLEVEESPITLEFGAQIALLQETEMPKDGTGPVDDFTAGGHVLTLALTARHDF